MSGQFIASQVAVYPPMDQPITTMSASRQPSLCMANCITASAARASQKTLFKTTTVYQTTWIVIDDLVFQCSQYCYTFAASVDNAGGLGGVVTHTVPAMGQHTYQPPAKSQSSAYRGKKSCTRKLFQCDWPGWGEAHRLIRRSPDDSSRGRCILPLAGSPSPQSRRIQRCPRSRSPTSSRGA